MTSAASIWLSETVRGSLSSIDGRRENGHGLRGAGGRWKQNDERETDACVRSHRSGLFARGGMRLDVVQMFRGNEAAMAAGGITRQFGRYW